MFNILKELIANIKRINSNNATIDINARTIVLSMPRRTGKTTALRRLAHEYSTLVFTAHPLADKDYSSTAYSSLDSLINSTRGTRSKGLKYSIILIDEEMYINLPLLVVHLCQCNMLEQNYAILKIGTL